MKKDISQLLVDYGVYNQSGINAIGLDKALRKLLEKEKARTRKNYFEELLSLYGFREFDDDEHTGFVINEELEMDYQMIKDERKRLNLN